MENNEEKVEQMNSKTKKRNIRLRMILVIAFLIIFAMVSYISLRGEYLEYLELGKQYTSIFKTNQIYRYGFMILNFIFLYFVIYFTNRGIKKGLKVFFDEEKVDMPKLPNKSLALVISAVTSYLMASSFAQKIMLIQSGVSFGINDKIYGLDIAYYIFQKPFIEAILAYFTILLVGISVYSALYHIIIFNRYFDGVEGKTLKESLLIKKLIRNIFLITICISAITILNTQNVMFGKILTVNEDLEIRGAGMTESTIKVWGFAIFALVIIIAVYRAIRFFKKEQTGKVIKNLAIIPGYLVSLFIVMSLFDLIYVKTNELDKEKGYIEENIKSTKNAYNISIDEQNLDNSGTITEKEVEENSNIINNIPVISQESVLTSLENVQTETGYFVYPNADVAKYKVNNEDKLVYIAPREIKSTGRTYSNKTYEYTHGMGTIIASATNSDESGNIQYIQKDISGEDNQIEVSEPRIYFGVETKDTIATNARNKQEYDYTDETGKDYISTYTGKAGLKLGFLDRLILGIKKGDLNLAFSGEITSDSKILMNREVTTRASKALPNLIYDSNPYTVITGEGKIVWVVDAYTVSSAYPYSQYTTIVHDGIHENINYIRNSVKVLVDSYDGTMEFYITDRNDPIAMAYNKIYPELFMPLDSQIPEDIAEHIVYPEFLYKVQAEILKTYHNVRPDVLYRADDIWDISKFNTSKTTKATGIYMEPYYTMVKTGEKEQIGLIQIYTPDEKQNIISYLVGSTENGTNKLKLYKFSADSNIVGPMQLDKQIEEDEAISSELATLNVTGTKLSKRMIIVPINSTLLYIEPIYQTMLNESEVPMLRKVIVASGNKVAIGDNLNVALEKLLSKYAVDIEVENTDDMDGLIDSVIKANNNLNESLKNSNWEMIGTDINKLQELIKSLEELKTQEDQKKAEKEQSKQTDKETESKETNEISNESSESDAQNNTINESSNDETADAKTNSTNTNKQ